ncbi:MAG TPA: hypothetical protein [Caudoviricetes sp.]|nr:MAG TPA: hypothetical protein [Caudoviricetes sp.]
MLQIKQNFLQEYRLIIFSEMIIPQKLNRWLLKD